MLFSSNVRNSLFQSERRSSKEEKKLLKRQKDLLRRHTCAAIALPLLGRQMREEVMIDSKMFAKRKGEKSNEELGSGGQIDDLNNPAMLAFMSPRKRMLQKTISSCGSFTPSPPLPEDVVTPSDAVGLPLRATSFDVNMAKMRSSRGSISSQGSRGSTSLSTALPHHLTDEVDEWSDDERKVIVWLEQVQNALLSPKDLMEPLPVKSATDENIHDLVHEEATNGERVVVGMAKLKSTKGGKNSPTYQRVSSIKRNINRFSSFVKSGTEAYLLSISKVQCGVEGGPEITIFWTPNDKQLQCRVDPPVKYTKLKGLQNFLCYPITETASGVVVKRRYKHFEWIHIRLSHKFTFLPVPPLPEKITSSRKNDTIGECRVEALQCWVDKICRHPAMSQSEIWRHFCLCTDEKKWKLGKLKAEKDDYVGGNWFLSVVVPFEPVDTKTLDNKVESFNRVVKSLDESVKIFSTLVSEASKKMSGPRKRDTERFAAAFQSVAQSFHVDDSCVDAHGIARDIVRVANNYEIIAKLIELQPKIDLDPLADSLNGYKKILLAATDMISTHKAATQKLREYMKMCDEGKIKRTELEAIRSRGDVISYVFLAEVTHLRQERNRDFKEMIEGLLEAQVAFHTRITGEFQRTLKEFKKLDD